MNILIPSILACILGGSVLAADGPLASPDKNAEAMRQLRLRWLTATPAELGFTRTDDANTVYCVLMDWPISGGHTATVVALSTGDASLYTTSSFGVFGGIGHERVRNAAAAFISEAEKQIGLAAPTEDRSYPDSEHVRFFFLTFDGLRCATFGLQDVGQHRTPAGSLFEKGQFLLTELRLVTQQAEGKHR